MFYHLLIIRQTGRLLKFRRHPILKYLAFTPSGNGVVRQSLRLKTFEANHSANIGFSTKGWTFTPEIGFNFKTTDLVSDLSNIITVPSSDTTPLSAYSNDLTYTTATPYGSVGVNYKMIPGWCMPTSR